MKTLVVIPAYNEEETIFEVVTRSLKYADVSVTNDGSKDKTGEILLEIQKKIQMEKENSQNSRSGAAENLHSLHIITHEKSTHIPKGIQDGLKYGVENGYDFIITMDAGLSHNPDALQDFINYDKEIDVVIGKRRNIQNVPLYRRFISKGAARIVNYTLSPSYFDFRGRGIADCTSGFRRYSLRAAKLIAEAELVSKSFDFHMEALALCVRAGLSTAEIPITYVFSNSSFNSRVLLQALRFAFYLLKTKR